MTSPEKSWQRGCNNVNKGHYCNNLVQGHCCNNVMKGKTARMLGKGQDGKATGVTMPLWNMLGAVSPGYSHGDTGPRRG
jgi:hypothetical protein